MATDEQYDDDEVDSDVEEDDDIELSELEELDDLDGDYDADDDEEDGEGGDAETDEADDDDEEDEEDAEEGDDVVEEDEDDEEEEESLDVILAREKVIAEDDIGQLDDEPKEALGASNYPVGAGEFTCRSCFLVKRRAQLADEEAMLCLDCA